MNCDKASVTDLKFTALFNKEGVSPVAEKKFDEILQGLQQLPKRKKKRANRKRKRPAAAPIEVSKPKKPAIEFSGAELTAAEVMDRKKRFRAAAEAALLLLDVFTNTLKEMVETDLETD